MNRKELYREITSLKLQYEVKAKYGKNYTQCTNEQLKAVVDSATSGTDCDCAFKRLVNILAMKKILLKSEVDAIMKD